MADFAKIVVIDGNQVLFYSEPDPDDETKTRLNQMARVDGLIANIAIGGISDDTGLIEGINEDSARLVLKTVRQFIDSADERA